MFYSVTSRIKKITYGFRRVFCMGDYVSACVSCPISAAAVLSTFFIVSSVNAQSRIEQTPAAVDDVVFIAPFSLEEDYMHLWRKDPVSVNSGLLVVFKVNRDLVQPRNGAEPVLYVGMHTVERLNSGYESGYVVGIIPESVDLSKQSVWFGDPELPERVTAETIKSQALAAEKYGIQPFDVKTIKSVTKESLQSLNLASLLSKYAVSLVKEYSPEEKSLVEAWLLPETP